MEIIAIVKFNDGEAFVFDKIDELINTKYGNDTIISTNGLMYQFLGYEPMSTHWKAFGGRKFDLKLSDGSVEHCEGQWWDKITKSAISELGINNTNKKIVYLTSSTLDELKKCYVFIGYKGFISDIINLRKQYKGVVYEYWDYEAILKGYKKPLRGNKNFLRKYRRKRFAPSIPK